MTLQASVAYFSMEVGLVADMPTYAGGLGVLAGDTLRSAADLGVPMVGVTLLHRRGYFHQRLDAAGRQSEEPVDWRIEQFLVELPQRVSVAIEGRTVHLRTWEYEVKGTEGIVPVYFLDADLPENSVGDRTLTHFLYGGDARYRLCQEIVLGLGGVRMLRALGYQGLTRFDVNEGHSSLLVMELLEERARGAGRTAISPDDIAAVRQQCTFTTHTPVPAGHDQFPVHDVRRILGESPVFALKDRCCHEGMLNLTYLALNFSLRYALSISREEVWNAHTGAKRRLVERVARDTGIRLDPGVFTLGVARRATAYKRADLLMHDVDRLKRIAATAGPLQVVYAGKAHPHDEPGKAVIERIFQASESLRSRVPVVYLKNYDMELGRLLTSGVDLWLNTPDPPLEASGTSGMKAALNGPERLVS